MRLLISLVALMFAVAGCGKKDPETPKAGGKSPATAKTDGTDGSSTPTSSEAIQAAPESAPPSSGTSVRLSRSPETPLTEAEASVILGDLTQTLRKFSAEKQRVPKSLQELVGGGYLKGIPPAPPGKKFAINEKRVEVVLVKQ
jgi:hypothetical protein